MTSEKAKKHIIGYAACIALAVGIIIVDIAVAGRENMMLIAISTVSMLLVIVVMLAAIRRTMNQINSKK